MASDLIATRAKRSDYDRSVLHVGVAGAVHVFVVAARFVKLADPSPTSSALEAELDPCDGVVLLLRRPSRCWVGATVTR